MRVVRVGNGRIYDVPDTFAEGEKMITDALKSRGDKGQNLVIQAIAARVAYGLFGAEFMAADPTDALLFLLRRICERKGAGLNYANRADQKDHGASGGHTR